ncbi:MAG: methyltransferase domain-containing protein [Isosphaeraceae bacterium]
MDSIESAVRRRINDLAHRPGPSPWGPVPYDAMWLDRIPPDIQRRDHGCGDPTRFLKEGDRVLDLGSGSGKGAYVAAQVVGPDGWVIGIDSHREMLALSRKHLDRFADQVGYSNLDFRCGLVQDLRFDLDELGAVLSACPIHDQWGYLELRDLEERLRREDPLVSDSSVDVTVANGVLSLVPTQDQPRVFAEMSRVLRPGGRAILCDLAADADLPDGFRQDPRAWSDGLGGVLSVEAMHRAFKASGLREFHLASRREQPVRIEHGVPIRLVTVIAAKPDPAAADPGFRHD